jgi:hypothetical protein
MDNFVTMSPSNLILFRAAMADFATVMTKMDATLLSGTGLIN